MRTACLVLVCAIGCTPTGRDGDPGNGGSVDAASSTSDGRGGTVVDAAHGTPDGPALQQTTFPINGPIPSSSPVIAGVTLSCHAMYAPKILRVRVLVTDPQGATDRGTGSAILKLPDGTQVVVDLPEPYSASPYEKYVKFGSGETLTDAQFTQACAAPLLELVNLTIADKSGHVTLAPSVAVPPTVGGSL